MRLTALPWLALGSLLAQVASSASAAPVPQELLLSLRAGEPVSVIVELNASAVERDAAARRARSTRGVDDDEGLRQIASRYRALKRGAAPALQRSDVIALTDYSHLPFLHRELRSEAALRAIAALPGVLAVHPDRLLQRALAQSLPLVSAPPVATAGLRGSGSTVAVIDDGIELGNAAFGACTAVATPATCRVAAVQSFVASPSSSQAHGSNVAAIVIGMAPDARVASLGVFSSAGASTSSILSAINWAISNRSSLNIVAINLSLGDGSHNTTACSDVQTNAFATPIANARNAGISVVAATGNNAYSNGSFVSGISRPACTPGALSVGAAYDSAQGGLTWFNGQAAQCTDLTTSADRVTCFSNSATFMSLLAPGAVITAAGYNYGGTSQAAPHVAGAVAVLRAAFPDETLAMVEGRLTSNGTPVTDARNGLTHPRLNLLASARPHNDNFAAAESLSTSAGSFSGSNRLATREAAEPGAMSDTSPSVWWRWTAPASGQVSLDTAGSGFDTRLDVYTGAALGSLVPRASNDNAGSGSINSALHFQAQAGSTYHWRVDGSGGASGPISLQWGLNTSAQANVSITLSGPATALPGTTVVYTLTLSNAGPQAATGVVANLPLPAGVTALNLPAGCSLQAAVVVCSTAELASGASVAYLLSLHIDSLDSAVNLSASLVSELPDPQAANNTVTAVLAPDGAANADVPALPAWAMLLLGGGLLLRRRS